MLRIYDQMRTAHLERLGESAPGVTLYFSASYDFDSQLAELRGCRKVGILKMLWLVVRWRPRILEVNEPAYFRIWPRMLVLLAVVRLLNLGRARVRVVSYAIENGPIDDWLVAALPMARPVTQALVKGAMNFIIRSHYAVAFGTAEACELYFRLSPVALAGISTRTFQPLAPKCARCAPEKIPDLIVFVGAFEGRKGVLEVISAFSSLPGRNLRLIVAGKGPLETEVAREADRDDRISVLRDPDRVKIHEILSAAHVLAMPSQPARRWKEQIGLPLLEGLSHGCEIVTTSETGISKWLECRGHRVTTSGNRGVLENAIGAALSADLRPDEIMDSLPRIDGRISADSWMCR